VNGWRGIPGARSTPPQTRRRIVWFEYQDPIGAGNLCDETLGFGIVDAVQLILVVKIFDRALVLDNGEALAVERQPRRNRPGVVDRHPMGLGDAGRAGHAGRRVVGKVHWLVGHRRQIVENALDVRKALDHVTGEAHGSFLWV